MQKLEKLIEQKLSQKIDEIADGIIANMLSQNKTPKTVRKSEEEAKYSDSAILVFRAFNRVNAHRNRVQKRTLVAEYKPNSDVTIKQAVWTKEGFKGVEDKTFKTVKGGVVIQIEHTKAGYTDEKFVSSVDDKNGKQLAIYGG